MAEARGFLAPNFGKDKLDDLDKFVIKMIACLCLFVLVAVLCLGFICYYIWAYGFMVGCSIILGSYFNIIT